MTSWKSSFLLKSLETFFKRLISPFNRSLGLMMIQMAFGHFNAQVFTQCFDFAYNLKLKLVKYNYKLTELTNLCT
jgi:hypothetical protein